MPEHEGLGVSADGRGAEGPSHGREGDRDDFPLGGEAALGRDVRVLGLAEAEVPQDDPSVALDCGF